MEIENNIIEIGKYTYSWVRDRAQWKFFATIFLALCLASVLIIGGGLLMAASILLPRLGALGIGGGRFAFVAGLGIVGVLIGLALIAVSIILSTYYTVRVLIAALKAKGFKTIDWTWGASLRYIWLTIVKSVYVALSLNEKKWLPLALAFYATIVLGIAIHLIWLISLLLLLPYTILVIYNAVRLSCSYPTYLAKGTGATESISISSKLTAGKAWPVFAIYAAIMLFWMVVMWVVSFVFQLIIRVILAVLLIATAYSGNAGLMLAIGVLSAVLLFGLQLLVSTFSLFTGYYLQAGIYEKVVNDTGRPSAKPAAASARPAAKKTAAKKK
jgi:hypothetical protein